MSFRTCFDTQVTENQFIKYSAMNKENNRSLKLQQQMQN